MIGVWTSHEPAGLLDRNGPRGSTFAYVAEPPASFSLFP